MVFKFDEMIKMKQNNSIIDQRDPVYNSRREDLVFILEKHFI